MSVWMYEISKLRYFEISWLLAKMGKTGWPWHFIWHTCAKPLRLWLQIAEGWALEKGRAGVSRKKTRLSLPRTHCSSPLRKPAFSCRGPDFWETHDLVSGSPFKRGACFAGMTAGGSIRP